MTHSQQSVRCSVCKIGLNRVLYVDGRAFCGWCYTYCRNCPNAEDVR